MAKNKEENSTLLLQKYERRSDSINGNFFTLPNKIFEEGLTPNEFVVYSFLIKAKDKKIKAIGQYQTSLTTVAAIPLAEKHCHHSEKKDISIFLNDTVIMCSKATSIRSTEFNVPPP